ncbi:hypothetical protein [Variovorax saccharolyticus]|uniref:hypothetical protein n=1 Tax=Variovorax saccharolyticus TaxID=3053516 RepID=UPI0025769B1C|nr:hypothetical protein [Variovorax sp. J31P216]MDM0029856.1 hypothetical protein [Variovorax sp. J31P216]
MTTPEVGAIAAAVKAAVPAPADWCLWWQWDWELTCMPRGEWAAWVQAIGAIVALVVAIGLPFLLGWLRGRKERRGHFEVIALDVQLARGQAEMYCKSKIKAPAYRLPLYGAQAALPSLLAHNVLSIDEATALARFYVDAESFNRCLDLTAALRQAGNDDWKGEISRNTKKAEHLVPGNRSRYDEAVAVLSKRLPRADLKRLAIDPPDDDA